MPSEHATKLAEGFVKGRFRLPVAAKYQKALDDAEQRTINALAEVIDKAVEAEKERCARVAENALNAFLGATIEVREAMASIAAAIRERGKP